MLRTLDALQYMDDIHRSLLHYADRDRAYSSVFWKPAIWPKSSRIAIWLHLPRRVRRARSSEIAAIRDEDAGGRELLWFHLNDGRMISGHTLTRSVAAAAPHSTLH